MYNLLRKEIKRFIRDKNWSKLRAIQEISIKEILSSDNHYIITASTASGKTEAAFLPVLSKINLNTGGVKVIYISPLKALINDQLKRTMELCEYLKTPVIAWHGDISSSKKKKLEKNPKGIMLTTPESLESMISKGNKYINHLFNNTEFIIIDEIHTFLSSSRGIHLQSLLSRLYSINNNIRFIGLSATLDKSGASKYYFGNYEKTKIIRDNTKAQFEFEIIFFDLEENNDNDLIDGIYKSEIEKIFFHKLIKTIKNKKILIFANSRQSVEEIATKLTKLSFQNNYKLNIFAHHALISKQKREYIEFFANDNNNSSYVIICTSTLELGIDIGDIDTVVQIDSTLSVSSLLQRLGRSGRSDNISKLMILTTSKWSLIHSIAILELIKEKFIEPIEFDPYPIDIIFHQILSILKPNIGLEEKDILNRIMNNFAFNKNGNPLQKIENKDVEELIKFMQEKEYLKKYGKFLHLGKEGEKIANSRNFYTVFSSSLQFKAFLNEKIIGYIPVNANIKTGDTLYLSSKSWKIININYHKLKVDLEETDKAGNLFSIGSTTFINKKIYEKIQEILTTNYKLSEYSDQIKQIILKIKEELGNPNLINPNEKIIIKNNEKKFTFYSFTGSKINNTISFLLEQIEIKYSYSNKNSSFEIYYKPDNAKTLINDLIVVAEQYLQENKQIHYTKKIDSFMSKWGIELDNNFKTKMYKERYLDFELTLDYLRNIILK